MANLTPHDVSDLVLVIFWIVFIAVCSAYWFISVFNMAIESIYQYVDLRWFEPHLKALRIAKFEQRCADRLKARNDLRKSG